MSSTSRRLAVNGDGTPSRLTSTGQPERQPEDGLFPDAVSPVRGRRVVRAGKRHDHGCCRRECRARGIFLRIAKRGTESSRR
jgi:hypothetical protein